MASDAPTRPASVPRYETLLDANLSQVRQKIRLADLTRGVLALACLLFGYALAVALLDLAMGGSDGILATGVRVVGFVFLLILVTIVATVTVRRYLTSVNPYFAARQLEETIPNAKNSLVNWLDLRGQKLPAAIRQSLGQKAARDIENADPELIVSSRDLWRLGVSAGVLVVGLLLLFALVPRQFGSLMARAFLPLRDSVLVSRTAITLLRPAGGNATVPAGARVDFLAQIEGRVAAPNTSEAPALQYRYDSRDVFVRVPLEEDVDGKWGVRLPADQVRTGLSYKLTAGDASTPEYQLSVAAQPFVSKFEATYTYRPYRKVRPETVVFPNEEFHQPRLMAHRGTRVALTIRANTPVKGGMLDIEQAGRRNQVLAQPAANDPAALSFEFTLEKSGTFRVLFDAADGTRNIDRNPYPIDVLEDGPPYVEIVKPGKDVEAPPNGTVLVDGLAIDDFGITELVLRLKALDGSGPRTLAPIPFVPKKPLRFDDGTYPTSVNYMDVILLDKLRTKEGKGYSLTPGAEITYWLEASDNFDYPAYNVGKSNPFKIKIVEPAKDPSRQQKEREDAQKKKQENDDKQGKDQEKKNQDRNQQGKNGDKQNEGGQPSPEDPQKQQLQKDIAKTADKLNKEMDKDKPQQDQPKDGTPQQANSDGGPGQPKDGSQQPKDGSQQPKDGSQQPMPGNSQPQPKGDQKQDGKEGNSSQSPMNSAGQPKDNTGEGNASPMGEPKKSASSPMKDQPGGKENPDKKKPPSAGSSDGDGGGKDGPKDQQPNASKGGSEGATKSQPDPSAGKKDPSTETQEANKQGVGGDKSKPAAKQGGPAEKKDGPTSENAKAENADGPPKGKTKAGDGSKDGGTAQKGEPKQGPDAKTNAQPKPGKESDSTGQAKEGEAKKDAAWAKGDGSKKGPPTREDVDKLKEKLGKGGADADDAAKELAQRGKDVTDPDLRKDIEDTLKKAGREEEAKALNRPDEKMPMPEVADKGGGAEPMKGQAPEGPKGKEPTAGGKEPGKGTDRPEMTQGQGSYTDNIKPLTADDAFKRRLGNLQLDNIEELKKRLPPEVRKRAGISETEWQQFLRNVQEYQRLSDSARKRDEMKELRKGVAGKLTPTGPRVVEPSLQNRLDPLATGQAAPPLEFQDAQRRFTRKTGP